MFAGYGQATVDLVNPKTKEWIFTFYPKPDSTDYKLISKKNDSCAISIIKVADKNEKRFLDSLKKGGFQKKSKFVDLNQNKNYKVKLTLISCKFISMYENEYETNEEDYRVRTTFKKNDSVFNFHYKIEIMDAKTKSSKIIYANLRNLHTLLGRTVYQPKQEILKGFAKNLFGFLLYKEESTSIYQLDLVSNEIFGPETLMSKLSSTFFY
jgi:hypothetical protein